MADLRTNITESDGDLAGLLNEERAAINAVGSALLMDLRNQAGVVGDGVADDAAAINTALASAAALGARAFARGTFSIASTVTITSATDLADATFNYTGSGVAVQVGNPAATVTRKTINLPTVVATAKTVTGWAQVAGTTAVRVTNANQCIVTCPRMVNFEVGFLGHGQSPSGTQFSTFYCQHIDNCKVPILLAPQDSGVTSTSGWFNQNTFIGGRTSHNSNEGTQIAGTRNLLISSSSNIINGNIFIGVGFESPDVVEYHIECYGQYNRFINCRFENTGGDAHRRVYWRAGSKGNVIDGGFNSGQITEVVEAGARNEIRSDVQNRFATSGSGKSTLLVENAFSTTAPAFTIMESGATAAGADPATAYAMQVTARQWAGKRAADTYPRFIADTFNGRIYVGDASAAPVGYIGGSASSVYVGGGLQFIPLTNAAQDLGNTSLRWRNLWLSGNATVAGNAVIAGTSQVSGFTTSYGTAAPTTGLHAVGDEQKNSAPAVGQPKSWVCTVAGTPGTWVSTGNL